MKISLFIPVWKRFEYISNLLEAWIRQVDDITVWDDSGEARKYPEEITVIRASKRQGSHIKFKSAQMLKNDMVLISDDDVMPSPNLVIDLVNGFNKIPLDASLKVITIFGRRFSENGYQSQPLQRADLISEAVEVDWAGRLIFGHRLNFMVDITKCPDSRLDDLFWAFELRRQRPRAKIFSIPTKEWSDTPDANSDVALSRSPGYWGLRDDFVKQHYGEYFIGTGGA